MVARASGIVAALILLAAPGAALAGEPVAIVQSIEASGAHVSAMQLVEPGQVFDLGRRERLVLGYFESCMHEEITGGRVTVGLGRSTVENGRVRRRRVECDGGALSLNRRRLTESPTLVIRGRPGADRPAVIRRTRPIIGVAQATGPLCIVRLDRPTAAQSVRLDRGFADLAASAVELAPGGLYRLSAGARSLVVRVDVGAQGGGGPALGRLIVF